MLRYERDKHELLLLQWFLTLRSDPTEFENLFAEPLRNLTTILNWAERNVEIMFEMDTAGISMAAWVEPFISGAFFGAWCRKDRRGAKSHLKFMTEAYDAALETFPVLIGVTKQAKLHSVHVGMGYEYVGEIKTLFDGAPARVYQMTRETRANERINRRREIERRHQYVQSLRSNSGEIRTTEARGNGTDAKPPSRANKRSPKNGRNHRPDTNRKPRGGRSTPSGVDEHSGDEGFSGEGGTRGQQLRARDYGESERAAERERSVNSD